MKVELTNRPGTFVTLDEDGFHDLILAGIKPHLVLAEASGSYYYVRCGQRAIAGRQTIIARHLTRAAPGQVVSYRNGDRLDLRRRNLILSDKRPAPPRSKPRRVILGSSAGQDMRPDGGMGSSEATSGYAFAGV